MKTKLCLKIGITAKLNISSNENFVRNTKNLLKLNNFLNSCQLIY